MTLKELNEAFHAHKMRNTKLPPHAVPRTRIKDKTEKDLKTAIASFCKLRGWGFLVYDAKGRQLPNGKWAYSHMTKGAPDCIVFIPVRDVVDTNGEHTTPGIRTTGTTIVVHVEIKMRGDRQRPHQRKFQQRAEERGERYIMPNSWETFFRAIKTIDK